MPQKKYIELLENFCALNGIPEVAQVLATGNLRIKDVAFTLLPPPASDPDTLRIFCDYGSVPSNSESTIYRRLLEINLLTCSSGCFVFNPENKHVLLYFSTRLSDGDAASLRTCLERCADEALKWRENYYLETGENMRPANPAGATAVLLKQLSRRATK